MIRRGLRAALAAAVAAPLLIGPVGAEAATGAVALTCRSATQSGSWQRLPVTFRPVPSVPTRDVLTGYSLDASRPQRVLVTNGNTIRVSDSHGCSFQDSLVLGFQPTDRVPLSGTTSTVVATASLPGGPSLALVREGTGPASRPHVLRSGNAAPGSWAISDSGLPLQGSPRLLEPANATTAYLTLSPATDSGGNGGTLPTLPGIGGGSAGPAGLLYATTDGGRSWSLRTPASALPGGITGFDALAVDPRNPNLLYAIADGRLVVSRDGGRSLTVNDEIAGATAVEPMETGEVAVFVGASQVLHSKDGGQSFTGRPAPAGVGSAAYRKGDSGVVVEADGQLLRVDVRGRAGTAMLDAGVPATRGSARGDRAEGGSFHATAGNLLLRYVDPRPVGEVVVPRAPGDLGTPPPPDGTMSPASRSVRMPVGESRTLDFTLALPPSPTPLDMYLLVDTSGSMTKVIGDLKANLLKATQSIAAEGIDLRVGIGAIGYGPREGEDPYPEVDPTTENYKKPTPYTRIREVGEVNQDLLDALGGLKVATPPRGRAGQTAEGQLIALQQMITGKGILEPNSVSALPSFRVAPGQDAGFRKSGGVRSIVVQATNEAFADPYGTPMKNGKPDIAGVGALLKAEGIKHVGLAVVENGESKADLGTMARLTDTLAPEGGVDCGDYVYLDEGDPLVCDSSSNFSQVMARLVKSLADRQSVSLVVRGETPLVGGIDAARLRDLDVTQPNAVPFRVQVSCADRAAGSYTQSLEAVMRGFKVASARIDVTCTPLAVAAAVPPRPQPPAVQDPAPPAQPAQAPAVPAPAPPVVQAQAQAQVQSQVQAQAQVQPLTAAALQQQEELQLALALLADERSAPSSELAMVDRGRSEELRALALLSLSMGAASAVGLARLRTRRADSVRVRRVS